MVTYITEQGQADRLARRRRLQAELDELRASNALTNQNSASENKLTELLEVSRQEGNLIRQINQIDAEINGSEPAPKPTDTKFLRIGHMVTIQQSDDNGKKLGKPEQYLVAGYNEGDTKSSPQTLGYNCQTLQQLMGRSVGEEADVLIAGKWRTIRILKIQMPDAKPDLKVVGQAA